MKTLSAAAAVAPVSHAASAVACNAGTAAARPRARQAAGTRRRPFMLAPPPRRIARGMDRMGGHTSRWRSSSPPCPCTEPPVGPAPRSRVVAATGSRRTLAEASFDPAISKAFPAVQRDLCAAPAEGQPAVAGSRGARGHLQPERGRRAVDGLHLDAAASSRSAPASFGTPHADPAGARGAGA